MPTCRRCGADPETEELVRHEREGLVLVHCPSCNGLMGQWRDPARGRARSRK